MTPRGTGPGTRGPCRCGTRSAPAYATTAAVLSEALPTVPAVISTTRPHSCWTDKRGPPNPRTVRSWNWSVRIPGSRWSHHVDSVRSTRGRTTSIGGGLRRQGVLSRKPCRLPLDAARTRLLIVAVDVPDVVHAVVDRDGRYVVAGCRRRSCRDTDRPFDSRPWSWAGDRDRRRARVGNRWHAREADCQSSCHCEYEDGKSSAESRDSGHARQDYLESRALAVDPLRWLWPTLRYPDAGVSRRLRYVAKARRNAVHGHRLCLYEKDVAQPSRP